MLYDVLSTHGTMSIDLYSHKQIDITNFYNRSERDGFSQERQELTVTVSDLQAKITHDAEVMPLLHCCDTVVTLL
jgi:hypothetical protein